jgi:hypothetical protein
MVLLELEIMQSAVYCINAIFVLHRNFITDNDGSLGNELVEFRASRSFATGASLIWIGILNLEWAV